MNVIDANGAKIPAIGLGTMTLKDAVCVDAVKTALQLGYRHIDTAERYGNEAEVGEGLHQGLRASGLKREDVFITTKVYHDKLAPADFERSFDESLGKLKLPWVDLLLIHWPNPKVPLADTLRVLCKARRDGRAKHVGVANFTTTLLAEATRLATEPLVTNQIEVHPFIDQSKVLAASTVCRSPPIARSPAARFPATRYSSASPRPTARARRRSRCVISCSRASSRSRAPPIPAISPPISQSSTSN